ncbi:MAG: class I SAM-dependent methyltransferase [Myxococcota bacterium]
MRDLSLRSWADWMAVPRGRQAAALREWLANVPAERGGEEWNQAFGPGSLFDAWTRSSVMRGVYEHNVQVLRPVLQPLDDWSAVEIGGGDGRLWHHVGASVGGGSLTVIDPSAEVHSVLPGALPDGIALKSVMAPVQQTLGDADVWGGLDAVVCSLTLHHLAGIDAAERAQHGLVGPGKREVLQQIRASLKPGGILLLNEADVHCDLALGPGSEGLQDRLMDSYVRRCAGRLLADAEAASDADPDLRARWRAIARAWCLEQVRYADVPVADRDVYELDVLRWMALLNEAGFRVRSHQFTDEAQLFHQYVAVVA